ncbi:hypothetical protein [Haloarcula amylolytica]|nr:hypothetical protein [Haloarcula amylolytica]
MPVRARGCLAAARCAGGGGEAACASTVAPTEEAPFSMGDALATGR